MRCARCVCCLLYNVQRRCAEVPARAPLRSWTEVMGDSREAGAEAPPAGASAQGGLSLLSQGESEEPSAQVSLPRGGTSGLRGRCAHSAGKGCHGSRRPLAPSPRLPGSPQPDWTPVCQSGIPWQVPHAKSSCGFPLVVACR